jgi:hypothetical protein
MSRAFPCNFLKNGPADAQQLSKLIRSIKPIGEPNPIALLPEAHRKPIDYVLNQRHALCRLLDDAAQAGQRCRQERHPPSALGRKNRLFAAGGRNAQATTLFLVLVHPSKNYEVHARE